MLVMVWQPKISFLSTSAILRYSNTILAMIPIFVVWSFHQVPEWNINCISCHSDFISFKSVFFSKCMWFMSSWYSSCIIQFHVTLCNCDSLLLLTAGNVQVIQRLIWNMDDSNIFSSSIYIQNWMFLVTLLNYISLIIFHWLHLIGRIIMLVEAVCSGFFMSMYIGKPTCTCRSIWGINLDNSCL